MKALKNDSIIYTEQIVSAIRDCYAKNAEPSNAELLTLYSFIGQSICEQGEKAFVAHLAQALDWTQNAVILDCCESDAQRLFYIALATEKNLSKLALMKAIESKEFETAQTGKSTNQACPACCPVVGKVAA